MTICVVINSGMNWFFPKRILCQCLKTEKKNKYRNTYCIWESIPFALSITTHILQVTKYAVSHNSMTRKGLAFRKENWLRVYATTELDPIECLSVCVFSHSIVSDPFVTPQTVACQIPLTMGFVRQEYWSGLPILTPADLSNLGINLVSLSPTLTSGFSTTEPRGKPHWVSQFS